MKAKKALGICLWSLLLFWFAMLTFLSSQPGPDTAQTSLRMARFMLRLLHLPPSRLEELHQALRISAHFVGFFILGGLLFAAFRVTYKYGKHIAFWAGTIGSGIGILDEAKKLFIAGRHLSFAEASLNVLGIWCGIGILFICIAGCASFRQRKGIQKLSQ